MRKLMIALATVSMACGAGEQDPEALETATLRQGSHAGGHATGLVLDSVTGVTLPLIGQVGEVILDEAVITNLTLVEDIAGAIVGVEADGILQLSGGVLGTNVVTEDFNAALDVISSGAGKCSVLTLDLGSISVDALGLASVDVPAAAVNPRASGAVGSLLCTLGSLLQGIGGAIPGAQGVVNAINNQL